MRCSLIQAIQTLSCIKDPALFKQLPDFIVHIKMLGSCPCLLCLIVFTSLTNGNLILGFLSDVHIDPILIRQSVREVWDNKISHLFSNSNRERKAKQFQAIEKTKIVDLNSENDVMNKVCQSLQYRPDILIVINRCACSSNLLFLSTALKLPVFEISIHPKTLCKKLCQDKECTQSKIGLNKMGFSVKTKKYFGETYKTLGKQFQSCGWRKMILIYDDSIDVSQISIFIDQLENRMHQVIVQKLNARSNSIQENLSFTSSLINNAMEDVWESLNGDADHENSGQIAFLLFTSEATVGNFVLKVIPDLPFSFYVQYYIVDMDWMNYYFVQSLLFRDGVTVITKSKKHEFSPVLENYERKTNIIKKLNSRFGLLSLVIQDIQQNQSNYLSVTSKSCVENISKYSKNDNGFNIPNLIRKHMGSPEQETENKYPYYVNDISTEIANTTDDLQFCNIDATGKVICQDLDQNPTCKEKKSYQNIRINSRTTVKSKLSQPAFSISARSHYGNRFKNKTFRVVTVEDEPFVFVRNGSNGQQTFSGFSIDLLNMLSELIGFQYEIYQVKDKKYGTVRNGKWNGLVGDVVSKKADIAIAAMTITPQREMVLDFTKRYMDYAVGILMKKPKSVNNLFAFLNPFDNTVWYSIIAGLFLVSILLYVLNRVSPKRMPGPPYHDTSLHGTFWFVYSSLVQQGTDMNLVTLSSQIVTGVWWFFILIIISSYTANLAAHLTVTRLENHISSFRDLSKQNEITFGTALDTSIFDFLKTKGKNSKDAESMWSNLWKVVNGSNSVSDPKQGFAKVKRENYAFMWDVAVIEYLILTDPDCMYSTVSDSIYDKGYGIGVAQGNEIRDAMSMGILELQDSGEISRLKHRWWSSVGMCQMDHSGRRSHSSELTLENFAGVFCVLACGLVIASLVAVFEICRFMRQSKTKRMENDEKTSQLVQHHVDKRTRRPRAFVKKMVGDDIHIVLSDRYH